MMNKSAIDYVDFTWNPITGCLHGCNYCYAAKQAMRFCGDIRLNKASDQLQKDENGLYFLDKPFKNAAGSVVPAPIGFEPLFHRYRLPLPAQKLKPANIFVGSMCDMFGYWLSTDTIREVFDACGAAPWHQYLFLTKNPKGIERAVDDYLCEDRGSNEAMEFFSNFWFGTTITCMDDMHRLETLAGIQEGHRFLSIEPLLGPVSLDIKKARCPECGTSDSVDIRKLTSKLEHAIKYPVYCDRCCEGYNGISDLKPEIDWVIIGAEGGNQKGKVIPERAWIEDIVTACRESQVPVFMKSSLADIWGEDLIQEYPAGMPPSKAGPLTYCRKCEHHTTIKQGKRGERHECGIGWEKSGYDDRGSRHIPGSAARTSPLWCPLRGEEAKHGG